MYKVQKSILQKFAPIIDITIEMITSIKILLSENGPPSRIVIISTKLNRNNQYFPNIGRYSLI